MSSRLHLSVRRTAFAVAGLGSTVLLMSCGGGDSPAVREQSMAFAEAVGPDAAADKLPSPLADTQRPTVTLTSPANFASGLTGMFSITATASDDVAVESVSFQVDGAFIGNPVTAPPYGVEVDTSRFTPGQHVVRARSRDTSGNQSAWFKAVVEISSTRAVPAGFVLNQSWVTGLTLATAFAQMPDGRIFVAQQGGAVGVIKAGLLLATPFVQLAAVDSSGERGLVGITPDPAFASNGFVYLYYATTIGGTHNRISRVTADLGAGGDVVVPGSEVVLVDLPALSASKNENGGAIHFGSDGKLYVGVGHNGDNTKSQNLADPFGKMLRFNADGSIPSDNPFYATQTGLARAVWAYGLRNPFTFAVQPGTGRIHINDVGQTTWEEINLGAAGANYGYSPSEGPDNVTPGVTAPLFTYKHDNDAAGTGPGGFIWGYAIVGGTFYPAAGVPALSRFPTSYRNNYYFADYGRRFIGRMDWLKNDAYAFAILNKPPVDLLSGADGALYALSRSAVIRIGYGATP